MPAPGPQDAPALFVNEEALGSRTLPQGTCRLRLLLLDSLHRPSLSKNALGGRPRARLNIAEKALALS